MNDTCSDDAPEIDTLIRTFYSVFDNRGGMVPTIEAVVRPFLDSAVIAVRTAAGLTTCTPQEFAAPRVLLLRSGDLVQFHEWETWSHTRVHGDLACRTSRYSKSGTMQGAPYAGSGTKLFQLVRSAGQWRILSLAWQDDEQPG